MINKLTSTYPIKKSNPSNEWCRMQCELATERNQRGWSVKEDPSQYIKLTDKDEINIRRKIDECEERITQGTEIVRPEKDAYMMIINAVNNGTEL